MPCLLTFFSQLLLIGASVGGGARYTNSSSASSLELNFVITIIVINGFLAGTICRGIHFGRHDLMNTVRFLAHPTQLQLEVFILQLIVHLIDDFARCKHQVFHRHIGKLQLFDLRFGCLFRLTNGTTKVTARYT
uniref:Secreted protein n=1 Tax=Anopheles darlingi TaxID=43151 RepID=A0A2M4D394_ANODA